YISRNGIARPPNALGLRGCGLAGIASLRGQRAGAARCIRPGDRGLQEGRRSDPPDRESKADACRTRGEVPGFYEVPRGGSASRAQTARRSRMITDYATRFAPRSIPATQSGQSERALVLPAIYSAHLGLLEKVRKPLSRGCVVHRAF